MFQFFWQYEQCSGKRTFTTLAAAVNWADEFLARCPTVTILREA